MLYYTNKYPSKLILNNIYETINYFNLKLEEKINFRNILIKTLIIEYIYIYNNNNNFI